MPALVRLQARFVADFQEKSLQGDPGLGVEATESLDRGQQENRVADLVTVAAGAH